MRCRSAAAAERATAVAGGSALLVEDNPEVAEVSRDMLAELGYAVHVAMRRRARSR